MGILAYIKLLTFLLLLLPLNCYSIDRTHNLFYVERNKNKNIVQYIVKSKNNCQIDESTLKGYWKDLEKGPNHTRELTTFQRLMAYGVSKIKKKKEILYFKLNALNKYELKIFANKNEKGCFIKTFILMNSKWFEIEKVYVFATEGFILPSVKYIDFYLIVEGQSSVIKKIKF